MGNKGGASPFFGAMREMEQTSRKPFLEETMHKLRGEAPKGGIQGVVMEEGVVVGKDVQAESM